VSDARDRRCARSDLLGDVEIGGTGVHEARDLPPVRQRLELPQRAQVAEEPLRLVAVAKDEQRVRELVEAGDVLDRMRGIRLRLGLGFVRRCSMLAC